MLRLENTVTRWGDFVLSADLSVARGERVALLGASGSGKSSLLSLIAGFQRPDEGRILIDGRNMTDTTVAGRPLSILFQDGNLFPHLSVFQNVALGVRPDLRLAPSDTQRVESALEKVGLGGMGARAPSELSGGQQSRVALARMLLRDRPLVLLDEPFAALDPGLRSEMLGLMAALCDEAGLTLVMASHDLRDAERLCDRLILLSEGAVVLDMGLADALRDPPEILKPWT